MNNLPSISEVPIVDAPPPVRTHPAPLLPQASTITVDLLGDSPLVLPDTQLVPVLSATADTTSAGGVLPPPTVGMDRLIREDSFSKLPVEDDDALPALMAKFQSMDPHAPITAARPVIKDWRVLGLDGKPMIAKLIATGSWRALAEYSQDRLLQMPATSVASIFEHWYYRLIALIKRRYFKAALEEGRRVADVVTAADKPKTSGLRMGSWMIPFPLRIQLAMIPCLAGEDPSESVQNLYHLLYTCRNVRPHGSNAFISEYNSSGAPKWAEREAHVLVLVADCLIKMNEFTSAEAVMQAALDRDPSNVDLMSGIARMLLQVEEKITESQHGANVEPYLHDLLMMNRAFSAMGSLDYQAAATILSTLVATNPSNVKALNNLAVCLLYLGRLQEAIVQLEAFVLNTDYSENTENIIFNLTTLYELSSDSSTERKKKLVENIVRRTGDNFDVACLKLPSQ